MSLSKSIKTDFKSIKYFEGLNALRFIAAILVVFHHGEAIRKKNGLANLEWVGFFRNGGNAVTFFFVLSGFLITYLLLKENFKTDKISVQEFYLKRVLRIWPLYFLLVFTGTVFLPLMFKFVEVQYEMPYNLGQTWYFFFLFLPGLVTFYYGHHFLEPLWSIGVEEVFYLIWAPLFKIFKNHIFNLLIAVIISKLVLWFISEFVTENEIFRYLVGIHKFEAMAIGGLGAYWVFNKGEKLIDLRVFSIPFQWFFISLLVIYLCFHGNIHNQVWDLIFSNGYFSYFVVNILFLYLILTISVIPQKIIVLGNPILSYLGEISYGIYMYHMLIIFTTMFLFKNIILKVGQIEGYILYYIAIIGGTIVLASISKKYFEDRFLKLRKKMLK